MSGENKCTWALGTTLHDPHNHQEHSPAPKILDTILDHVGNTPLVRINKITQAAGIECEILAKCEFFNAGGSVKDRIAKRMIEEAEKDGRLKPGYTIIEPTTGNTGIGLALAGAVKGYQVIISIPEKMSKEKVNVLKALGADIVRAPDEAGDSLDSYIGVASLLKKEIPNSVILDQYTNPYNSVTHYDHTAEEIFAACDGKVDVIVAGAGTGGTITGIARKLKEKIPGIKIIGVDPIGSIYKDLNEPVGHYKIEGIGHDFVPAALDRLVVDEWYKSNDKDSFIMARRLIREEGLLCGGSSGAAMCAAIETAKSLKLKKGQRLVVLLTDSIRNYMTKFMNDDWMKENGFLDEETMKKDERKAEQWDGATIKDLNLPVTIKIVSTTTCLEAKKILEKNALNQLPVVDSSQSGNLIGLVAFWYLQSRISADRAILNSPVSEVMFKFDKEPDTMTVDTPLEKLTPFFEYHSFAIVTEAGGVREIKHIATKIDLLSYLNKKSQQREN